MIKNKKGFIAISTIYAFIVVFLMIMLMILNSYYNNRVSFDLYKNSIKTKAALGYSSYGLNITNLYTYINNLASTTSSLASGLRLDNGEAYHFFGSSPNNFICLNTDDKNICADNLGGKYLYRIVGTFKESIFASAGGSKYLTKIVRDKSYGNRQYHNANVTINWESTTLCNELNTTFLNSIDAKYQNMIADVKWNYLRTSTLDLTASNAYINQKNSAYKPVKKIGLLSASDWGYASKFDNSSNCKTTDTLLHYNDTFNHNCYTSNYLNNNMWLIDQSTVAGTALVPLATNGKNNLANWNNTTSKEIYPALYLKSDVIIVSGTGTSADPYIINMF